MLSIILLSLYNPVARALTGRCTGASKRAARRAKGFAGLAKYYRIRNYRGRVSTFDQSEARKQCFLASDWLKFDTLPR